MIFPWDFILTCSYAPVKMGLEIFLVHASLQTVGDPKPLLRQVRVSHNPTCIQRDSRDLASVGRECWRYRCMHWLCTRKRANPVGQYLHQQPIAPQTVLSEGRIDPFDSYPVTMQPYMHQLVDYCTSFLLH